MFEDEDLEFEREESKTVYSQWFPRRRGRGSFTAAVIQSDGEEPKLVVSEDSAETGDD